MLTESKTEILLKIGAILGRVHTGISTMGAIEVDANKIGELNVVVLKTEVDDAKTDEILTRCSVDGSVEEATNSSVDEVLGTSTIEPWSWEELSADWVLDLTKILSISPTEANSTDVILFCGV